jgi:hypothetical protein
LKRAKRFQAEPADWLDGEWEGLGLPEEDERRGKTPVCPKALKELGRQDHDGPRRHRHPQDAGKRVIAKAAARR